MNARFNPAICCFVIAPVLLTASTASADTIATFADPSLGPDNPLFELSNNKLNGGWSDLGLTLIVPLTGMVYPSATSP